MREQIERQPALSKTKNTVPSGYWNRVFCRQHVREIKRKKEWLTQPMTCMPFLIDFIFFS